MFYRMLYYVEKAGDVYLPIIFRHDQNESKMIDVADFRRYSDNNNSNNNYYLLSYAHCYKIFYCVIVDD